MSEEITEKREESIEETELNATASPTTPERTEPERPALIGLPVNPMMRVNCGDIGVWGYIFHQGCIAAVRLEGDGSWSPSQIIPKKLAEYMPVFIQQHDALLAPYGYPALVPAEPQTEATAEAAE